MTKDLRGFLAEYERENPKEFCRIKREVDPEYEVAGILTKLPLNGMVPFSPRAAATPSVDGP